jgi:hypothetical protein
MKSWLIRLAILAVLLLTAIPNFFSAPAAKVEVPAEARFGEDARVKVSASAWHYKFQINQVDLELKTDDGGAAAPGILLYKHPGGLVWWQSGRLLLPFWPSSEALTVELPLQKLSREGKIRPDAAAGILRVTTVYRRPLVAGYSFGDVTQRFDFQIRLTR